jgi:uroporphyrinogen-III synthase
MLPLTNRRILITRPRNMTSPLVEQLKELGAVPIVIPTIELVPPPSCADLDAALRNLGSFSFVVFTSPAAVQAFAARAALLEVPAHPRRVAVIGPATASAVHGCGILAENPILRMPPRYVAEALLDTLLPYASGANILLPRARFARELLPDALRTAGANVTVVEAYQNVIPPDSVEELEALFRQNPPDAILFTSASTAENLAKLLRTVGLALPEQIALASIGPITSQAMRDLGMEPAIEAREATIPALVDALCEALARIGELPAD